MSDSKAASSPATPDAAASSAGRGVIFIGAAKIYFMIAGAAIEFALPNLLGKYGYGAYRLVASSVSLVNNVVVTGTIQAVSRQTTADPARAAEAKATGLKLHRVFGVALAALFALAAPLAAHFFKDDSKTGPLALASLIIAGYSIYAVFVGSANGTRQFHKQAGLDVTFATLRALFILTAAALGLGIYGAIGGWVAGVLAIMALAAFWVGGPRGAKAAPIRPMLAYFGAIAAYLILTNAFMSADQFLLKRLSTNWFLAHGHDAAAAAREADGQVGLYGAVQQLARLPYQLMVAVTFVIFPLVSQATFENDRTRAASYVRTTLRYSLVFAGAMGAALAAHAEPLLDVPFTTEFAQAGGPALSVLALGHVAFAIFTIGGTILNSMGRTRRAVTGAGVTLVALVGTLLTVLPGLAPGRPLLLGAALCTSGAMVIGAALTGAQLFTEFRVFVPILTVVRVLAATAAAFALCRFVPVGNNLFALFGGITGALVYLVVLWITGELGRADLARVRALRRGA